MALDVIRYWRDKYLNTFQEGKSKPLGTFKDIFSKIHKILTEINLNSLSTLENVKDSLYTLNGHLEDRLLQSESLKQRIIKSNCRSETLLKDLRDMLTKLEDLKKNRIATVSSFSRGNKHFSAPILTQPVYGFKKQFDSITNLLLKPSDDSKKMRAIGIVGMGGSGKTTLASMVFNCLRIQEKFSIMFWVSLTKTLKKNEYTRADVMMDILRGVQNYSVLKRMLVRLQENPITKDLSSSDLDTYSEQIKEFLKDKKYLIVLDDVWDTEKWFEDSTANGESKWFLSRKWLNDSCGTIIVTTRLPKVAKKIGVENANYLQFVEPISDDACWSIIKDRINREEISRSLDLPTENMRKEIIKEAENMGKEIIKKCDNRPLAAITLGDIMLEINKERLWKGKEEKTKGDQDPAEQPKLKEEDKERESRQKEFHLLHAEEGSFSTNNQITQETEEKKDEEEKRVEREGKEEQTKAIARLLQLRITVASRWRWRKRREMREKRKMIEEIKERNEEVEETKEKKVVNETEKTNERKEEIEEIKEKKEEIPPEVIAQEDSRQEVEKKAEVVN